MRRSWLSLCSRIDLDGKASAYYPRFRPRRLVMPVDPDSVHSEKRSRNPLFTKYKQQQRRQRVAERRGAMTLSSVPSERTVGDMYRFMLEVCDQNKLFSPQEALLTAPWRSLERQVKQVRAAAVPIEAAAAEAAGAAGDHGGDGTQSGNSGSSLSRSEEVGSSSLSVRAVDGMWAMLDQTPLNAPVHGVLAQRGKAVVERTLASAAYEAFPRLRTKHIQRLLHETCGLLPASRVSVRLGFAQHAGVDGDISMWRELNVLSQRVKVARRNAAAHLERMEKGIAQQRRWYWRGVLKSAQGRLRLFPVHAEDLQPRLEWVRSSLFAFVGFLEMAQRSGEIGIDVETFILKMYCSQLGQFVYTQKLVADAERLLARSEALLATRQAEESSALAAYERAVEDLRDELTALQRRSPDEMEVLEGLVHPLNERAYWRQEQFQSSGGMHAVQSLKDELVDEYQVERHSRVAPPIIVHSMETQNALKEIQLILRYAPDVSAALRNAPIDVDQVVRKTVEVHETNSYASLHYDQQYRQVEYTVCRLFCGKYCIGEGKGETLMMAIQMAAMHAVSNYYLNATQRKWGAGMRGSGDKDDTEYATSADGCTAVEGAGVQVGVRMRKRTTEEELAF